MLSIQGRSTTSGEVTISGSKNAALPIIAAALLLKQTRLTNVPDISDVHDFCHAIESLGGKASFENNVLEIETNGMSDNDFDPTQIGRTRAGIYFIPALLRHFDKATLPYPGGDKIGKRPIDEHVDGYKSMGYSFEASDETFSLTGAGHIDDVTVNMYFRVSATANVIMGAVGRKGTTTIELAAFEPHIFCLIDFLRKAGAEIQIRYDHSIIIHGGKPLADNVEFEVISDYLQSGTFAIIGALTSKEYLDIHNARIPDLSAFLYKLHESGVRTEDKGNDTLRVFRSDDLKAVNVQTNIFPGFPTDLQPLFSVLMTQAKGTSKIQEIMYESRLGWLVEYEVMGGHVALMNPHEALIFGKTPLHGAKVNSWDLRSGSAMVIAGMVAEGETQVSNIYWIHRGYEKLVEKLQGIGVAIQELSPDGEL